MAGPSNIIVGNSSILDLTSDTVTPQVLYRGYTAHAANGDLITGTAEPSESSLDESHMIRLDMNDEFNVLVNPTIFSSFFPLEYGLYMPNESKVNIYRWNSYFDPGYFRDIKIGENVKDCFATFYATTFSVSNNLIIPNKVERCSFMFYKSTAYRSTNIIIGSNVKDASYMFYDCLGLIPSINIQTLAPISNTYKMFGGYGYYTNGSNSTHINVGDFYIGGDNGNHAYTFRGNNNNQSSTEMLLQRIGYSWISGNLIFTGGNNSNYSMFFNNCYGSITPGFVRAINNSLIGDDCNYSKFFVSGMFCHPINESNFKKNLLNFNIIGNNICLYNAFDSFYNNFYKLNIIGSNVNLTGVNIKLIYNNGTINNIDNSYLNLFVNDSDLYYTVVLPIQYDSYNSRFLSTRHHINIVGNNLVLNRNMITFDTHNSKPTTYLNISGNNIRSAWGTTSGSFPIFDIGASNALTAYVNFNGDNSLLAFGRESIPYNNYLGTTLHCNVNGNNINIISFGPLSYGNMNVDGNDIRICRFRSRFTGAMQWTSYYLSQDRISINGRNINLYESFSETNYRMGNGSSNSIPLMTFNIINGNYVNMFKNFKANYSGGSVADNALIYMRGNGNKAGMFAGAINLSMSIHCDNLEEFSKYNLLNAQNTTPSTLTVLGNGYKLSGTTGSTNICIYNDLT